MFLPFLDILLSIHPPLAYMNHLLQKSDLEESPNQADVALGRGETNNNEAAITGATSRADIFREAHNATLTRNEIYAAQHLTV